MTKSIKIVALQQLPQLEAELSGLAAAKRIEKLAKIKETQSIPDVTSNDFESEVEEDSEKLTENTPEARVEIYKELAAQKQAKEERSKVNAPRERDYTKEQIEATEKLREAEKLTGLHFNPIMHSFPRF